MALINCPECGREISDRVTACPHCGYPLVNEPIEAAFCLKRESKALFCAIKYEVFLDNQMWGILKNGESLNTTLTCGVHHLRLIDKNNFNKVVYDSDFTVGTEGLTMTFSAAMSVIMCQSANSNSTNPQTIRGINNIQAMPTSPTPTRSQPRYGRICPHCGGTMAIQTVSEARKSGCGTVLLYLILALTIFGLLIVIPLMLRKKTDTVTYAICQSCGYKQRL